MGKQRLALAVSFVSFALLLVAVLVYTAKSGAIPEIAQTALWTVVVVGRIGGLLIGLGFKGIPTPWGLLEIPAEVQPAVLPGPPKELSPELERERRNYLSGREHQLPGFFAPAFQLLDEKVALTVTPCGDPMTPMYMLDRNFRIIDDWTGAI